MWSPVTGLLHARWEKTLRPMYRTFLARALNPPAMCRALRQIAVLLGRWACLGAVLLGVGLSGCQSWNLRGESFAEDEFSNMPKRLRPFEPGSEAFGVSNKALQIERNLGFR